MSVRTTSAEVLQILDSCTLSSTIIDVFIASANRLVDVVYEDDTTMTSSQLEDVELWLTAHMISSTLHRTTSKETIGDTSVSYTGYWSKNLQSTPYGQMCLVLDTSGLMGNVGKQAASITAVKGFD